MTCRMRENKPVTQIQQAYSSVPELPYLQSETHRVVFIDSTTSIHLHKVNRVTRFVFFQIPEVAENGIQGAEKMAILKPVSPVIAGDIHHGSKHLLFKQCLEAELLTFHGTHSK